MASKRHHLRLVKVSVEPVLRVHWVHAMCMVVRLVMGMRM